MNENSDPGQRRRKNKLQPKIHRRKNDQIPKQFFCPVQNCQKGYGSYAALYTHMKNKHNKVLPPKMPITATKIKQSHPGRPKIKKQEKQDEDEQLHRDQITCKICQQEECECVQNFDSQQKNKVVQIMSNEKFTSFTNEIGMLSNEQINWVRRTEEEFVFKSKQTITKQIQKFNKEHSLDFIPSQKLIEYLSFSSKYWDPAHINELYQVIYAMVGLQNHQQCIKFVMEGDFPHMRLCVQNNLAEFKKLQSIVRII